MEDWKKLQSNNLKFLFMCYMKKKWKYARLIFQNITQPVKKK